MRDGHRIEDRPSVRLERPQLVWLTLGGVVAMGLCFALGVLVGKREARVMPPPVDVAQADANGQLHKELTFYDTLTAPGRASAVAGPPVKPRPAPQAEATAAVTPTVASPPPAPSAPAPVSHAPAAPLSAAAAAARVAAQAAATPDPGERAGALRIAPPRAAGPSDSETLAELARGPAHRGDYTVQVSSFQTAAEADAYASVLARKGYKPFVVSGSVKGKGTWYRVRVGAFKDAERARSAKVLLAQADIPAWIVKTE